MFMNGFIKLFCLALLMSFLSSCVPTEIGTVAQCGPNEAYDAVKRICYNTTVPHQPPTPTLKRIDLVEDQVAQEFILTYTDVDGDLATNCSIISRGNGINAVTYNCQCQGGICTVKLQPDPDFSGFTEMVYSLTDINGVSAGKSVAVYVAATNDAPVASNVAVSTNEDNAKLFTLTATDQDGDNFYFVKLSDPTHGSIVFNGATGTVTYTPTLNYFGSDSFLYKVCDYGVPSLCSANYTVSLTVNPVDDAPVASLVSFSIAEGATGTATLSYSDIEGDAATVCSVTPNGSVVVNNCLCAGGVCTSSLTASGDFNGLVNLSYTVTANGLTSAASQIAVTVTPVNDTPVLTLTDPLWSKDEGVEVTYTQADLSLAMNEGGTGSYEASQASSLNVTWVTQNPIPAGAKVVNQVDLYYNNILRGSFTTNNSTTYLDLGDGTAALDASKFKMVVKTKAHESGKLIFSIKLKDDGYPSLVPAQAALTSAAKTITLEIIETNDAPVITAIADLVMNEGDEPYTQAFTIDEGPGDTEDSQNITVSVASSNTNLLPGNNIRAWYRHKNETLKTEIPVVGGLFSIPTTYGVLNTQDLNSGNYYLYLKVDPVDGMTGTANITLTATDNGGPAASATKTFAVTVNPVGGNHGGWTKVNARGMRTDKLGNPVVGFTTAQVELGWNNFSTATSAANSNHVISGWRVFRRTTGYDYDWSAPINATDIASNTTSYTDTTVSEQTVYYYTVRPVDSSTLKLTIPTKEVFSEVRVFVPPANQVFVHRWMVNQEVCKMMLMTEDSSDPSKRVDPTNSFRCPYQGPGETWDGATSYYDIGKDMVVDAVEVGCPYTNNPLCGVNGCIGITAPTAVVADGNYYYNRQSGICYLRSAGAWQEVDAVAAYIASNTTLSNRSFLPPLANISQEKANDFCRARGALSLGGQFSLPTRKEQIAYSSWDESYTDFQINEFELGQFINSSSKCNSSAASGVDSYYSDNIVPNTSYLYTIPGTKTSQIRSLYTGSQAIGTIPLTNKCQSRYGLQDVYGNLSEWVRDRFVCYPGTHPTKAYTCDSLTSTVSGDILPADTYILPDGSGASFDYYDIIDNFFVDYRLDGVRGPCQDNLMNDGICDSPMTSWAIEKTTNLAGQFIFPVGLPARTDYTINFPYSDVGDFLLPIGSTQGIEIEKLHNDGLYFNTYSIYQASGLTDGSGDPLGMAGVATGGSYLTTSDAGRYSLEFVPTADVAATPANKTVGSTYVLSVLHENEAHLGSGLRVKTLYPWWGAGMTLTITSGGAWNYSVAGYDSVTAPTTANISITYPVGATTGDLENYINSSTPRFLKAVAGSPLLAAFDTSTSFTPYLTYRLRQAYAHDSVCLRFVDSGGVAGTVTDGGVVGGCRVFSIEIDDLVTTYSQIDGYILGNATLNSMIEVDDFTATVGDSIVAATDLLDTEDAGYRFLQQTMILSGQMGLPDGQLDLDIAYGATPSVSVNTATNPSTVNITIAQTTSAFALENLINSSPTLSGLIKAKMLFITDALGEQSGLTSTGDLTITSDLTGEDWNGQKISLIDGVSAGSEYAEYDSDHIKVYIEAGVTSASTVASLINTHPSIGALVTAVANSPNALQGAFSNIFLENGVDLTPNRRTDIGFRCVAPVETGHYPADTFHTYPGY